jgi:uncharacterized delta-60 repeat protein
MCLHIPSYMKSLVVLFFIAQLFPAQLYAQAFGSPDEGFGLSGVIVENLSTDVVEAAECIAVQPNGKILVGGITKITGQSGNTLVLLRYNVDGTLDNSFGISGKVITDVHNNSIPNHELIKSIAIQPDGKIVAGGYAQMFGNYHSVIVRYLSNGNLDASFGVNGIVTTQPFSVINSIALLPDGKILTAGQKEVTANFHRFSMMRLLPNGTMDGTFGNNGVLVYDIPGVKDEFATDLLLEANDQFMVAGISFDLTVAIGSYVLARFHSNGQIDTSFREKILPFEGRSLKIVRLDSGKLLAAGGKDFQVVRLFQDGSMDPTFGVEGRAAFPYNGADAKDFVVLPDGKIVVGGHVTVDFNNTDYALVCYTSEGQVATNFGNQGIAIHAYSFSLISESINALGLQADGKIVGAGYQYSGGAGNRDISVVRFWGDDDGTTSVPSEVETMSQKSCFSIQNNPITDHLACSVFLPAAQPVQMDLVHANGSLIASWGYRDLLPGTNNLQIDLSQTRLPAGFYFLRCQTQGQMQTLKLMKTDRE